MTDEQIRKVASKHFILEDSIDYWSAGAMWYRDNNPSTIPPFKCDVCGCHPSVIITTAKGTFCQEHVKY